MRRNWKNMRKTTGAAAAASVIGLTVLLAAGCGVKTSTQETESQEPSRTESTVPQTSAQEETQDIQEPETISPLPSRGEEKEEKESKRIILMTDIHYLSPSLNDGGEAFTRMVEHGDGKLVNYVEEITDAALDEVVNQEPDVLILSGDLTLEGEKESHEDLAEKLRQVEDAGISVVVIPGNHDINNTRAAGYRGASV